MPAKLDSEDVANRREQLRRWIALHFDGKQAAFLAATKMNQGELSGLLKNKSFGEKKARKLEGLAKMPAKYLDQRAAAPEKDKHALSAAMRAPAQAHESQALYGWPFKHITPENYAKLSENERIGVERLVALLLSAHGVRTRATTQLIHAT